MYSFLQCFNHNLALLQIKITSQTLYKLLPLFKGDLIIYINGEPQGVAAEGLPAIVYAIIDLYGKCVQVSITNPLPREHNNDDCLSGSSMLAIDNDILNVTLGGDLSELSLSSNNSLDVRMDMSMGLVNIFLYNFVATICMSFCQIFLLHFLLSQKLILRNVFC